MEIELLEKTDNSMKISFLDSDDAFVYLLLEELWEDKKVSNAELKRTHPTLEAPTLTIEVSEGKPQAALKRAIKSLGNKFKDIRTEFEKVAG
ncbi:MAG: RpoL/Rpb11 RNA polymerase subunit family protein [Candidatus Thermoplasmatota archaeon]|nr:RpoL/Rpb11 RNA polymerase subunit family protein [Candidatus Thermoplasmatota archaeon]